MFAACPAREPPDCINNPRIVKDIQCHAICRWTKDAVIVGDCSLSLFLCPSDVSRYTLRRCRSVNDITYRLTG